MSSVCDSQYPPNKSVLLTSQNRTNASSDKSVPPLRNLLSHEISKLNNSFSLPSSALVSVKGKQTIHYLHY